MTTITQNTLTVTNDLGRSFNVLLRKPNARYGETKSVIEVHVSDFVYHSYYVGEFLHNKYGMQLSPNDNTKYLTGENIKQVKEWLLNN